MKNSSSLTGEISILMAHQAQLSRIMKIRPRRQPPPYTGAVGGGRRVAWPRAGHLVFGVVCFFDSQLMHV